RCRQHIPASKRGPSTDREPAIRLQTWPSAQSTRVNAGLQLADFVVLSDNPLSVGHLDPMKIKDIKVLKTIVGGETVFEGETSSIVANHFAE
ncbi:hypothetical protein, partial [Borborobacter arsenicus]|uniref:hypothetical protein n=1 Tax=Borborobacter arsenicus TaxID=1851146 RepID=UPI003CCAAFDE